MQLKALQEITRNLQHANLAENQDLLSRLSPHVMLESMLLLKHHWFTYDVSFFIKERRKEIKGFENTARSSAVEIALRTHG